MDEIHKLLEVQIGPSESISHKELATIPIEVSLQLEEALGHCLAEHLLQGGIPASRVFGIVRGVDCLLHVADKVNNLVTLGSLQVVRPSQAILLGEVPCNGHGLVQGLASHLQGWQLSQGDSWLLGSPNLIWGERQPVVLIGDLCIGEDQPGSLGTAADVEVGDLHDGFLDWAVTASTVLNQLSGERWAPPEVSSYWCSPKQLMEIKASASKNMLVKAKRLKI